MSTEDITVRLQSHRHSLVRIGGQEKVIIEDSWRQSACLKLAFEGPRYHCIHEIRVMNMEDYLNLENADCLDARQWVFEPLLPARVITEMGESSCFYCALAKSSVDIKFKSFQPICGQATYLGNKEARSMGFTDPNFQISRYFNILAQRFYDDFVSCNTPKPAKRT